MNTYIFDMPDGHLQFLFRGRDGEIYVARFYADAREWRISELHHLETGKVVYWS